eukprot:scaffold5668_cov111-Isochrysis_galbana.AAC.1
MASAPRPTGDAQAAVAAAAGILLVQKARSLRLPWVKPTSYCAIPTTGLGGAQTAARTVLAVFFYKQKTRAIAQAQPPEKAVLPSEPKQEEAGSSKPEDEAQGGEEEDGEEEERKNLEVVGTRTRRNLRQAVMMPRREVGAGAEEACQVATRECSA